MPILNLTGLVNAGRRSYGSLLEQLGKHGRNTSMWGALSAPVEQMTPEQQRTLRNTAIIAGAGGPLVGPVVSSIDAGLMALPEMAGNLGQFVQMAASRRSSGRNLKNLANTRGPIEPTVAAPISPRFAPEAVTLLEKAPAEEVRNFFTALHGPLADAMRGQAPIAVAENAQYRVSFVPVDKKWGFGGDAVKIVERKDRPGFPVATGGWMDFWEPYMRKTAGVTEQEYGALPLEQRAQIEANNQLRYLEPGKSTFPEHFARTYHPQEWREWINANKRPSPDNPAVLVGPYFSKESIAHWKERLGLDEPLRPTPMAEARRAKK